MATWSHRFVLIRFANQQYYCSRFVGCRQFLTQRRRSRDAGHVSLCPAPSSASRMTLLTYSLCEASVRPSCCYSPGNTAEKQETNNRHGSVRIRKIAYYGFKTAVTHALLHCKQQLLQLLLMGTEVEPWCRDSVELSYNKCLKKTKRLVEVCCIECSHNCAHGDRPSSLAAAVQPGHQVVQGRGTYQRHDVILRIYPVRHILDIKYGDVLVSGRVASTNSAETDGMTIWWRRLPRGGSTESIEDGSIVWK